MQDLKSIEELRKFQKFTICLCENVQNHSFLSLLEIYF
jgi:hypothetical protein